MYLRTIFVSLLATGVLASPIAFAQDGKVGTISKVDAWKNLQGPGGPSLHIIGRIMAKNACFDSATSFMGLSKSNPPIYLVKVELVPKPGVFCPQVEGQERDIDFRYDDPAFGEQAVQAEVSSDINTETVEIKEVQ